MYVCACACVRVWYMCQFLSVCVYEDVCECGGGELRMCVHVACVPLAGSALVGTKAPTKCAEGHFICTYLKSYNHANWLPTVPSPACLSATSNCFN